MTAWGESPRYAASSKTRSPNGATGWAESRDTATRPVTPSGFWESLRPPVPRALARGCRRPRLRRLRCRTPLLFAVVTSGPS